MTGKTTRLSLMETLMIAADLTGDTRFTHDDDGNAFFGTATTFISYFWHAAFAKLADAIERRREQHDPSGKQKY